MKKLIIEIADNGETSLSGQGKLTKKEIDHITWILSQMNPITPDELSITKNKKWITKDGTEIPISEMTGSHLINTIEWLERNAKKLHLSYLESGHDALDYISGEMAEVSIESELNRLSEIDDIEFLRQYTQYEELLEETEKRGLRRNNQPPKKKHDSCTICGMDADCGYVNQEDGLCQACRSREEYYSSDEYNRGQE